jgi:hypothetical protein
MERKEWDIDEPLNLEMWYQKYGIGRASLDMDEAERVFLQSPEPDVFKYYFTSIRLTLRAMEKYGRFDYNKLKKISKELEELLPVMLDNSTPTNGNAKKLMSIHTKLNRMINLAKPFERVSYKPDKPEEPEDETPETPEDY